MNTITLDPELRARLNGLDQQMEVRDEGGRVMGHFLPAGLYRELVTAWGRGQFTDRGERDQARQEVKQAGGLTTAEARAYLGQVARKAKGAP
jgi:hypothetical protein